MTDDPQLAHEQAPLDVDRLIGRAVMALADPEPSDAYDMAAIGSELRDRLIGMCGQLCEKR